METLYKYNSIQNPEEKEWSYEKLISFDEIKQDSFHQAAKYIKQLKKQYNCLIYTDYDTDGLTSGIILKKGLEKFFDEIIVTSNQKRSSNPNENEGYNLNIQRVDRCITQFSNNKKVILISADTGITDLRQFEYFSQLEIIEKSIILDHHEPVRDNLNNKVLPNADFVIDFKAQDNLESKIDYEYCTAGLCWIFIYSIAISEKAKSNIEKLLPVAAIATVADMVPLEYGNYAIVKAGIDMLNNHNSAYLYKGNLEQLLLKKDALTESEYFLEVTSKVIGFNIAPVLNSSTRVLGNTDAAIKAITGDIADILYLKEVNELRKEIKKILTESVKIIYESNNLTVGAVSEEKLKNFIASKGIVAPEEVQKVISYLKYADGIVGIIASDILSGKVSVNQKGGPKVAFCGLGSTMNFHGSLRAKDGCSIINALNKLKEIYNKEEEFIFGGGHNAAAGISIKNTDVLSALRAFDSILQPQQAIPKTVLPAEDLTKKEVQDFMTSPGIWGVGRENPIFQIRKTQLRIVPELNNKNHQRWSLVKSQRTNNWYFMPIIEFTDTNGEQILMQFQVYQQDLDEGFNLKNDYYYVQLEFIQDENGKIPGLIPAFPNA